MQSARRANWLDTLAAAYAEIGQFDTAQRLIAEASVLVAAKVATIDGHESVADLQNVGDAYAAGLSYVQAVRTGKIRLAVSPAGVNDVRLESR